MLDKDLYNTKIYHYIEYKLLTVNKKRPTRLVSRFLFIINLLPIENSF